MKTVILDKNEYEIVKNYRNGFNKEQLEKKYTDYFSPYDYIVGDIAYGSLRLKGFYESTNKKVKKINNYNNVDSYLKENCAHDCKHFILKKIEKAENATVQK